MNFVKRGLRSLLYHWKNTAALVVIYFLSSALVLVGLNIRQACLATAEEAGEKIGADIAVTNTYQANSFTAEERNNLPLSLAEQLAALPGVSSASWTATFVRGLQWLFLRRHDTGGRAGAPALFSPLKLSSLLDLFTSQGASLALGRPLEREDRGLALVALPPWRRKTAGSWTASFRSPPPAARRSPSRWRASTCPERGTGPGRGAWASPGTTPSSCAWRTPWSCWAGSRSPRSAWSWRTRKTPAPLPPLWRRRRGASPHQGEFVVQVDDSAYLQVAGPLERMVSPDDPHGRRRGAFGGGHPVFALPAGGEVQGSGDRGPALPGGGEAPDLSANALGAQPAHGGGGHLRRRGGRVLCPRGLAALAGTHSGPLSGWQIVLLYIAGILLTAAAAIPTAWKVSAYSPVKMLREE